MILRRNRIVCSFFLLLAIGVVSLGAATVFKDLYLEYNYIRALESESIEDILGAMRQLREMRCGRAGGPLLPLLLHESNRVRNQATETLRVLGRTAVNSLAEALRRERPAIRILAARKIRHLGPEGSAAVPALILALRDPAPGVRCWTAAALEAIGLEARPAVPALIRSLRKDDVEVVRCWAASALGHIAADEEQVTVALREALRGGSDELVRLVERILKQRGVPLESIQAVPLADRGV